MTKVFALAVFLVSFEASAFPEMIRHGYVNCTACHTTLVGGGLLNEYGRSLSRELLSAPSVFGKASSEDEGGFLHGAVTMPENWLLGGDIRLLQTFAESKAASQGRFLVMQIDFDFSYQAREWLRFFGSFGRIESRKEDAVARDFITNPRYGVEFVLSPAEQAERWVLRLGRFMPAYGIAVAEHTLVTRRYLDFSPSQERFAGELSWVNDRWSVIATGITGMANGNQNRIESGGILQVASAIGEKSKVGANVYRTKREDVPGLKTDRRIDGVFALVGFNKEWYALFEADRPVDAAGNAGVVEMLKVGREVLPGWHLFGVHEFANLDSSKTDPRFEAYSFGTEWFPKPHWDFYGLYRKERNTSTTNDYQDVIWLIAHYYL